MRRADKWSECHVSCRKMGMVYFARGILLLRPKSCPAAAPIQLEQIIPELQEESYVSYNVHLHIFFNHFSNINILYLNIYINRHDDVEHFLFTLRDVVVHLISSIPEVFLRKFEEIWMGWNIFLRISYHIIWWNWGDSRSKTHG